MKYRTLGSTNISISEIGFGTWGIGGIHGGAKAYGATSDEDSKLALNKALEVGINFFDTSDLYGFGHAESLLGEVFSRKRSDVVIATKGGFLSFEGAQDFSSKHLSSALDQSLKRLRTNFVDLYQLHSPSFENMSDEVFETLHRFKSEGKVRSIGVSVRSPEEGVKFLERFEFDAMQVNFNFVDQRALDIGLIDKCNQSKVGIIIRTPLAFGFLTGKYSDTEKFPDGDHRNKWSVKQRALWSESADLFSKSIEKKTGQTPAQIALRFCLSFEGVTSTIPGMILPEHVLENAKGGDLGKFSDNELREFQNIYSGRSFFE